MHCGRALVLLILLIALVLLLSHTTQGHIVGQTAPPLRASTNCTDVAALLNTQVCPLIFALNSAFAARGNFAVDTSPPFAGLPRPSITATTPLRIPLGSCGIFPNLPGPDAGLLFQPQSTQVCNDQFTMSLRVRMQMDGVNVVALSPVPVSAGTVTVTAFPEATIRRTANGEFQVTQLVVGSASANSLQVSSSASPALQALVGIFLPTIRDYLNGQLARALPVSLGRS